MTLLVAATITSHNRRDLTLRCLATLKAQEGDLDIRVVLVDDGSSDGTTAAVSAAFPDVSIIPADGTLYWAAGMALAEQRALELSPDVIVWLNDDVELDPTALAGLAAVSATTTPPAVVVGSVREPTSPRVSYGGLTASRWHPLRTTRVDPGTEPKPVDTFNGNVVWVPAAAIALVGGIDGGFPHAYADLDYGLRLRAARYPVRLAPGVVGTCPPNRRATDANTRPGIKARIRGLNSPKGVPLKAQIRFLRRHGPFYWPILTVAPYVKAVLGG